MNAYARALLAGVCAAGVGLWAATGAQAGENWDACAMLRQADVQGAFAPRQFGPGVPGKSVVKSTPTMATVSTCKYTSDGATARERISVSLLARRAPSDTTGVSPQAARAGAVQLKATPVDVAGLGEGAYWVNLGSSALPVLELNVFRGKRDWLVFSCAGSRLDTTLALASLTRVAKATMAQP